MEVTTPAGTISLVDVERVRKERDRHVQGGGTWQAWNRILEIVEDFRNVQKEIIAAEQEQSDDRASVAVDRWIPAGGTV